MFSKKEGGGGGLAPGGLKIAAKPTETGFLLASPTGQLSTQKGNIFFPQYHL